MRKFIVAAATLGILTVGGLVNANADGRDATEREAYNRTQQESGAQMRGEVWLAPGVTVNPAQVAPVYPEPMYEGRNVSPGPVYGEPVHGGYYRDTADTRHEAGYRTQWQQPGDAAIINQEAGNARSR